MLCSFMYALLMFTWTALTTFIAHLKNFFFTHYLYRYQQFQQEWPKYIHQYVLFDDHAYWYAAARPQKESLLQCYKTNKMRSSSKTTKLRVRLGGKLWQETRIITVIDLYRDVWIAAIAAIAAIASSRTSLATLTVVMCNTSQCK